MKQFCISCARVSLVAFMLAFSVLLAVPAVHAQTTSINNLSFPTTPVSDTSVRIAYDLAYSGANSMEALATYVLDAANPTSSPYASGTGSSTPDRCLPIGGSQFNDKTVCVWVLSSNSGIEHLTFDLEFSTHRQTYNLAVAAAVVTLAGTTPSVVYSSASPVRAAEGPKLHTSLPSIRESKLSLHPATSLLCPCRPMKCIRSSSTIR